MVTANVKKAVGEVWWRMRSLRNKTEQGSRREHSRARDREGGRERGREREMQLLAPGSSKADVDGASGARQSTAVLLGGPRG